MTEPSHFDVFLSYNSDDKPLVEQIRQRLIEEAKLRPFFDTWNLIPGDEWMPELEDALRLSKTVAVFIGSSGSGPWHHQEMQFAVMRAVREKKEFRVIPVLLPNADTSSMSAFLQLRTWVDFSTGTNNDIAFKRLVAGILGQATEFEGITLPDEPAPYRGLMQFKPEHARFFFGREQEIGPVKDKPNLIDKLRTQRFVAVVGSSGSGKSSIVGAGLLPRLAQDAIPGSQHWRKVTFTPADDPWRSLAVALASSHPPEERGAIVTDLLTQFNDPEAGLRHTLETWFADTSEPLLLFVDQLEELFTHAPTNVAARNKHDERVGRFVRQLALEVLRPDGRFRVVITLRADFMPHCLRVTELKELLQDRQLLLGELANDDAALREVIQRPAQEVGAMLETGLMEVLLADVRRQTGALPLLEHALSELWRERRGPWLTLDAYTTSGGVSGALEKRAEETFLRRLTERQQRIARRIFVKLTSLEEDTENTRRRVDRKALYAETTDSTDIDAVINVLAGPDARLIVADADTLSIAHETLIQNWPRLRTWLDEDHQLERIHRELEDAANSWSDMGRGKHPLGHTTSVHLAETDEHAIALADRMTILEREFLTACRQERENAKNRELGDEREKLRQQEILTKTEAARAQLAEENAARAQAMAEQAERLRRLAETRKAEATENAAKQSRLKNIGFGVAGVALISAAIAAWQYGVAELARTAEKIAKTDALTKKGEAEKFATEAVAAKKVAVANEESALKQQAEANRQTANVLWQLAVNARDRDQEGVKASQLFLKSTTFIDRLPPGTASPSETAARSSLGLAAHVSDKPLLKCWVHDGPLVGTQFSRDESRMLSWSSDNTARLWDVTKGEPLQTFKHDGSVYGARFTGDESHVLTWSSDKTARLWDVTRSEPIQTFTHEREVRGSEFSVNESRLLTWSWDSFADKGEARLWDLTKAESLQTFKHDGPVTGAQFSADESRVLTWSSDNTARLWDVTKAEPLQTFKHDGPVLGALFSGDESRVLTWSSDKTARLWDVAKAEPLRAFQHANWVTGAQFNGDESRVLTSSWDNTACLWDVTRAEPLQTFKHDGQVTGAQFNGDESRVLTWGLDNTARLWDVTKAEPLQIFRHEFWVNGAEFNGDESRVLTWSDDKAARVWDVTKAEPLRTFKHDRPVNGAQFSGDESRVLSWSSDNTARLWDVTKGEPLRTFKHKGSVYGAQFDVDESHVLTWSSDNAASLWDVSKAESLQIFKHDDQVNGAWFSRDASRVLTSSSDSTARVWDVTNGEPLRIFRHEYGRVTGAQFGNDASHVLTSSWDNTAHFWDVAKTKPLQTFKHKGSVYGAHFNRKGSRVLTWSEDKTARLWDVTKAEPLQTFKHDNSVEGAQLSTDESRVLTWSIDNTARVWDVTKAEALQIFKHEFWVTGAQFSRDASRVLTWCGDTARLWDVTKAEPLQIFKHDGYVAGAQFSADASRSLTWSKDNTARLWDVTKAEPLQIFKHDGSVAGAEFSGDESRVLTWSDDQTVRVWDMTKGEPIQTFKHDGKVVGARFSRDESRVLTWGDDQTARVWDSSGQLAAMTPAERILELEVRSGTTLDASQNLRTLKFDEWQAKARSMEYAKLKEKLAALAASARR